LVHGCACGQQPVGHDRSSDWDRLERAPLRGSAVPFAGKMLYALRR
jgi:hypothetical protein